MKNYSSGLVNNFLPLFGDERLGRRVHDLQIAMNGTLTSSVLKLCPKGKDVKGFYRALSNPKVNECELINEFVQATGQNCEGLDVLVVADTSAFNVRNNNGRMVENEGIGKLPDNKSDGFFLHPGMVLDIKTNEPLGYSAIKLWARKDDLLPKDARDYKHQSIKEKESNKWIEILEESRNNLSGAKSITIVEDREGDIYEQMAKFKNMPNCYFVIRARGARKTTDGKNTIHKLKYTKVSGTIQAKIYDKTKGKFGMHTLQIKMKTVELVRPKNLSDIEDQSITVNVVEVRSRTDKNLIWRIYTNKQLQTLNDAIEIIEIYKKRWRIELLFKLLKSEGYNVENSDLRDAFAIRKLTLLAMNSALIINRMRQTWHEPNPKEKITDFFEKDAIELIYILRKQLEGTVKSKKNPYPKTSIDHASWVIAVLGGWRPNNKQTNPGIITLKRGLEKFLANLDGYRLAKFVV
jgi:Transposase DDE domain